MTTAVELLGQYPELLAVVAVVARLARAYQSSLTWPEYRAAHRLKRGLFPPLRRLVGDRILLVSDKGGREDAEFVATIDSSLLRLTDQFRAAGFSLHLLNSLKRRPAEHGDPLTVAHLVYTHDDGMQTECYLFRNDDGTLDVYAHFEPGTDTPLEHLTGPQSDGDVRGVVGDVIAT